MCLKLVEELQNYARFISEDLDFVWVSAVVGSKVVWGGGGGGARRLSNFDEKRSQSCLRAAEVFKQRLLP